MSQKALSDSWRIFSANECRGYSDLYEQITLAVADSDEVLEFLLTLPAHTHQPNMLLAAVHDRVLQGVEPAIAAIYAGDEQGDIGAMFIDSVLRSRDELAHVMLNRFVQTNEIGRVAVLAPGLASLKLGSDATLVDVGTSAGLTLTLDHCNIDYGKFGLLGSSASTVTVNCSVLYGKPPVSPVTIARRIGVDRKPLDPLNEIDYRWLLACVWPDTGRLDRTRAALDLAVKHPNELVTGDAIADLPALLEGINGEVVVTTTWAIVYLPPEKWAVFADILRVASMKRPVHWISAEAPGVVHLLPHIDPPHVEGSSATVLGSVTFKNGEVDQAKVLAHVHSHGQWMWWYD